MPGMFYIKCPEHGKTATVSGPDNNHPGMGICWDCSPDDDHPVWCPEDVTRGARIQQEKLRTGGSIHVPGVNMTFRNVAEAEKWGEEQGLQMVSRQSREWRENIVDANRNEADKDARKAGFADNKARKDHLRANKRDIVAANRQEKIDAYVEEVGSDERVSIEEGYGALPANG